MKPDNDISYEENVGQYVLSIDFGTSKIRVCAALVYSDEINILGYGESEALGISEDGINSMDKLKESLSKAFNIANRAVKSVYNKEFLPNIDNPRIFVSIPGRYIECRNNDGSYDLNNSRVRPIHMSKAFNSAQSLIVEGKDLITATNNYYQVDTNNYIEDPTDLRGGQLKSYAHLVYADKNFISNIKYILSSCIHSDYVYEYVFTGTASALAVLSEEEKSLGVCVFDIGYGSVDISVYNRNYLIYSGSSSLGGHYITRSIAINYGLSEKCAEALKKECAVIGKDDEIDFIRVKSNEIDEEKIEIPAKDLSVLLESHYRQIFINALKKLNSVDLGCELGAGFVLTGGATKIPGVKEALENTLIDLKAEKSVIKVRVGSIKEKITGLTQQIDPEQDAVIIGLLKISNIIETKQYIPPSKSKLKNMVNSFLSFWQQEM